MIYLFILYIKYSFVWLKIVQLFPLQEQESAMTFIIHLN
jgi:hypothetical protein